MSSPASTPPGSAQEPEASGEAPEGQLARFFGYSHDVLSIIDTGGHVLLINPAAERVLGDASSDLVGSRILDRVHPEDQPRVREHVRALLADQGSGDLDIRLRHLEGHWVPMRWSLSVGSDRRLYAVGRDISSTVKHRAARISQEMAELRLRTAMELHDGVLQTLTGASLQIAAARRILRADPEMVEGILEALSQLVEAEQRELRLYVDEVKGAAPAWTDARLDLPKRIEALLDRLGVMWGMSTEVTAEVHGAIGPEESRQVLRIIQEASVNAARHGRASNVTVAVTGDGADILISVGDDGEGFPFRGEYDHEALQAQRLGPLSLKHRVAEAGGTISIRSQPGGSRITVRLPEVLREERA